MFDPNETIEQDLDPPALHCLKRTRASVLNVLVAVGVTVALSGTILRDKAEGALAREQNRYGSLLLGSLLVIFALSTMLRRGMSARSRLSDPFSRGSRFYWGHVVPALVGAMAAPLGLVYGLLIAPRLDAILPFWITALVLGILAYPRGRELEGFDLPMEPPGEPV